MKKYSVTIPQQPEALKLFSKEIGRGAYGAVREGEYNGRPVAVKTIHKEIAEGKPLEDFIEECRLLDSLDHPNIVKSYGAFMGPFGQPMLVLERLKENLREYLKRNRGILSRKRQLEISLSIASGLKYLHERTPQMAHRDVSDKNVLIAEDGSVKVSDLGQSKLLVGEVYMTTAAPGNILYMPPEVLVDDDNESPHYSVKVDVFSFGVLLLQIITQESPSCGLSNIGSMPELQRRRKELSKVSDNDPIKRLIKSCLQDNYRMRPEMGNVYEQLKMFYELPDVKALENQNAALKKDVERLQERESKELLPVIESLKSQLKSVENALQDKYKENLILMERESKVLLPEIESLKSQLKHMEDSLHVKDKKLGILQEKESKELLPEIESLRSQLKSKEDALYIQERDKEISNLKKVEVAVQTEVLPLNTREQREHTTALHSKNDLAKLNITKEVDPVEKKVTAASNPSPVPVQTPELPSINSTEKESTLIQPDAQTVSPKLSQKSPEIHQETAMPTGIKRSATLGRTYTSRQQIFKSSNEQRLDNLSAGSSEQEEDKLPFCEICGRKFPWKERKLMWTHRIECKNDKTSMGKETSSPMKIIEIDHEVNRGDDIKTAESEIYDLAKLNITKEVDPVEKKVTAASNPSPVPVQTPELPSINSTEKESTLIQPDAQTVSSKLSQKSPEIHQETAMPIGIKRSATLGRISSTSRQQPFFKSSNEQRLDNLSAGSSEQEEDKLPFCEKCGRKFQWKERKLMWTHRMECTAVQKQEKIKEFLFY